MNNSDFTHAQLRNIKKVLMFGAACLFVSAATDVYFVWDDVRENTERHWKTSFREQATTLEKAGEWDALLELAKERQRQRPRDAHAFYFASVAQMEWRDFENAKASHHRAVELAPWWKQRSQTWLQGLEKRQKAVQNVAP